LGVRGPFPLEIRMSQKFLHLFVATPADIQSKGGYE
jgi:hypothetical protein